MGHFNFTEMLPLNQVGSIQLINCQELACENLFLQIIRPTPRDQWVNTLALQDNKGALLYYFANFVEYVFFRFDIFYSGHGVLAEDNFECIDFEIKTSSGQLLGTNELIHWPLIQDNNVDITLLFCKFCGVFFHFDMDMGGTPSIGRRQFRMHLLWNKNFFVLIPISLKTWNSTGK